MALHDRTDVGQLANDGTQPDGYLTEQRKQEDPDHGFSTFFSETGASCVKFGRGRDNC